MKKVTFAALYLSDAPINRVHLVSPLSNLKTFFILVKTYLNISLTIKAVSKLITRPLRHIIGSSIGVKTYATIIYSSFKFCILFKLSDT